MTTKRVTTYLYPAQRELRAKLYGAGGTDQDIAAAIGVTASAISAWRRSNGLARNNPASNVLTPEQHERRLQLHGYGQTDGQIAQRVGVHKTAIQLWRKKYGLKRNHPNSGVPIAKKLDAERRALHKRGLSDMSIAKRLGVTKATIEHWRVRAGLPINRAPTCVPTLAPHEEERRMKLYREARSDRDIARLCGSGTATIASWRRKRGLPVNRPEDRAPIGPISVVSLDADLGEGGFNRYSFVADDAAAAWLEEVGATQW